MVRSLSCRPPTTGQYTCPVKGAPGGPGGLGPGRAPAGMVATIAPATGTGASAQRCPELFRFCVFMTGFR